MRVGIVDTTRIHSAPIALAVSPPTSRVNHCKSLLEKIPKMEEAKVAAEKLQAAMDADNTVCVNMPV